MNKKKELTMEEKQERFKKLPQKEKIKILMKAIAKISNKHNVTKRTRENVKTDEKEE